MTEGGHGGVFNQVSQVLITISVQSPRPLVGTKQASQALGPVNTQVPAPAVLGVPGPV